MKIVLDNNFKQQLIQAKKRLEDKETLKKSETLTQYSERPQLSISTQDLFRIRNNN